MYKLCQTEKSLARQRELENGILTYLETNSFFEIEVAALCRHLDIPRKTFYRYFGTKEDALLAIVDHRITDMLDYMNREMEQGGRSLEKNLWCFFNFWKSQDRFLRILSRNFLTGVMFTRGVILFNSVANHPELTLTEAMGLRDEVADYGCNFVGSGLLSLMIQWYSLGFHRTPEDMAQIALDLLRKPTVSVFDDYLT